MDTYELKQLAEVAESLEREIYITSGLKKISGGFVEVELRDYNEETVYLSLDSGVHGECRTSEDIEIRREVLQDRRLTIKEKKEHIL